MACSSTPATVAAPKPPPPKRVVVEEKEPEPPPEPLVSADVAFEQKWDFVRLNVLESTWESEFAPEDEIVKKLPATARLDYQALLRTEKQYSDASTRASTAMMAMYRGRSSGKKGFDAQYKVAAAAKRKAREAITKARVKAQQSLRKEMEKKPSPELGIALARLWTKHVHPDYYDSGRTLAYGYTIVDSDSRTAFAPLLEVVTFANAHDQMGKWLRYELVHHMMASEHAKDAKRYVQELLGAVSWDKKPLLLVRLGIIQGLEKEHAAAAETFRSAHEHLATTSNVGRRTLLLAEIVARYRAQEFERVLSLADEHWKEWRDPKPVKPDPNPPPPPPPAPKVTKGAKQKAIAAARTAGILGVLNSGSGYGGLGALSSRSMLSDAEVLRFATDAVERLARDPAEIKGDPEFRAGIFARLAARAFYRSDDVAAKSLGETAMKLGGSASREGVRVLKVLAQRAGDEHASSEIDEALRKVDYGSAAYATGIEHAYLDNELSERKSEEKPSTTPPVERNIRSLVRLCLEPVYQDLPEKAELKVSAKVFPNGKVEPVVEGNGGTALDTCVKQMSARVLLHAPTSVIAKVALARLDPAEQNMWGGGGFGSIFGDGIGESFGAGGLGLSGIGEGGGGTGEGIGLGSIRGMGRGAGGGGIGGIGGLHKAKPKKPKAPPGKK